MSTPTHPHSGFVGVLGTSVTVRARDSEGGLFSTRFTGTGTVAITSHGTRVVLNVDAPTYAEEAVRLVDSLTTSVRRTAGASALIGRGSGEAFQLVFTGQGFVIVQASEGRIATPHTH